MNPAAESILHLIKKNKGLSLEELTALAGTEDTAKLDSDLKQLIDTGYITFAWGKLYPNIRTLGLVPKGERRAVVEIELENLTVEDIRKVIQPYEEDPLFFDAYPVEEEQKALFEKRFGIEFDFTHFDYYLLCGFDHSEEAG